VPADNVTGQVAIPGEAWRELILAAIRQGRLKLVDFPVIDVTRNKPLHREGVLRLRIDDAGAWLPAGDFMPFAVRFNLAPAIDLAVSRLALDELKLEVGDLAINLSAETFADYECRSRFIDSLNTRPELCQRLWVEVPVYGVVRHFDAFRELCLNLKLQGCRVGIENFGRKLAEVDKLAGLGVDYVKVDSSFVRGIDQHAGNREFLNGLVRMAHRIGILVIAAGVENQRELDSLAALGFDGATGPGVRRAE
jgi:EAL domain-containing protein (putative c-di-GMP-specific phosphodiesterase class I)